MISDGNRLTDGQLTFERGVDTGRSPSRIAKNQLAALVNATCRNDAISPRPGWTQGKLVFPDGGTQTGFQTNQFQRAFGYQSRGSGEPHLVLSIGGRLFRVDVASSWAVKEITFSGDNNSDIDRAWFAQVEEYLVWQDNQDVPLIYNGASAVRSDVLGKLGHTSDGKPKRQVPVGNCMAYVNGRLIVALPDGRSFTIGDIVGGPSGAGTAGNRGAALCFTENQFLNEVEGFSVPCGTGPIRAIHAITQLDTSLGQGPAQVFTTDAGFSLNLPSDRTTWLNVTYPIQTISLLKQGPQSQEAVAAVNGDLWLRTLEDIRSFISARREFNGTWANTGMSHEVGKYLDSDTRQLLSFGSAVLFDNRLLTTCSPRRVAGHGVVHRGLVALDFTPVTAIGAKEPPAWDGLWTGINLLQLVPLQIDGVDHCYAITLDNNQIGVWELSLGQRYDLLADGTRRRITMAFENPRFDFGNRLERKLFNGIEYWLDEVRGQVDVVAYHRPDQDPCWHEYQTGQVVAVDETCSTEAVDGCVTSLNKQPQFRPRLALQRPPDATEGGNNMPTRLGYEHQCRTEITGYCHVQSLRVHAERVVEETFGQETPTIAQPVSVDCCAPEDISLLAMP